MAKKCETCRGTGKVPHEWDDKEFEDYLTEAYGEVKVCGMNYNAGYALRNIDPTAFDTMQNDTERMEKCKECDGEGEIEIEEEVA